MAATGMNGRRLVGRQGMCRLAFTRLHESAIGSKIPGSATTASLKTLDDLMAQARHCGSFDIAPLVIK